MTISGKNYFSYDFPIDKTGKMFIIYNCSDTVGEIMADILDKESPVALPRQLKQILQQRIDTAYYTPGRKIDSVRKISAEFKVSSLTVQRALKQLESDGFVVSVPASGIFVNDQFAKEKKIAKIAFVFPEAAISREILDPEGWALNSEIYRGLLYGGEKYGAQTDFIYVDKDMEVLRMLRQVKKLRKYDAVVFAGKQLLELQLELAREKPVFQFPDDILTVPGLIEANYDRRHAVETLAKHAAECGCKKIGTVSYFDLTDIRDPKSEMDQKQSFRDRAQLFLQYCRRYGLETPEELQFELSSREDPDLALKNALKLHTPDFIFCNQTYFVMNLYEACSELGIQIGTELKVAAIASGMTFQGLIPSLTYVKVPMFELAVNIVRDTCRLICDGVSVSELRREKYLAPLIIGKSTMKYKTSEEKDL